MEINNDVRRVNNKVALFELEGIHGLLSDVIKEALEYRGCENLDTPERIFVVQKVRHKYLKFLTERKGKDNQSKLF